MAYPPRTGSFSASLTSMSQSTTNVYSPYRKGSTASHINFNAHNHYVNRPPPRYTIITTRSLGQPESLPKSRILPSIRNITIFSTLGTCCIIACIALVLLKHSSFWLTLAASFCGVLGAALYIEVALLISSRLKFKIVDEECQVADRKEEKSGKVGQGWSWDLRNIGKKKKKQSEEENNSCGDCHRNATTSQSPKSVAPSMTSISEEDEPDSKSEKRAAKADTIQKPQLAYSPTDRSPFDPLS